MKDGSSIQRYDKRYVDDEKHPHKWWLGTDRNNVETHHKIFQYAYGGVIPSEILDEVCSFHDSAQYHFITRLIFKHPDGSYDTLGEAFAATKADNEQYQNQ